MTLFVQFLVLGLAASAVYLLLGSSLILIYRGSGILNLAQGAYAMTAGYLYYQFTVIDAWPKWASVVVSVLLSAVIGALTHTLVMRPLRKSVALVRVIATLGVLGILTGAAEIRYADSGSALLAPSFLPKTLYVVHGVSIPSDEILLLVIALVFTFGLSYASRHTTVGLAMTAAAENEVAAASVGWSPDRLALMTWTLGAGLAGIAGVLIAPYVGLGINTMTLILIAAMACALFGKFESYGRTLLAALVMGMAQSEISFYGTNSHWLGVGDALPFVVVLLILMFRGNSLPLRGHLVEQLPRIGNGVVRARVVIPVAVLVLILMIWYLPLGLTLAISAQSIVGVILLSVVVLTGYAGQLSLAQAGIAGIGAFVAGRLIAVTGLPFIFALVAGVAGAVVFGLLFALPALRTRGVNLAVITLGIGVALQSVLFENSDYTGGLNGTSVVGAARLFGINLSPVAFPKRYAIFTFIVFVLASIFVANVRRSSVGRRLIAIRTNERAAASIGVSVFRSKLIAFGIASGLAGLGGVLFAFQGQYINYSLGFDPLDSLYHVGYTVVGGIGFASGPITGSGLAGGGVGSFILDHFGSLNEWLTVMGGVALIGMLLGNANGATESTVEFSKSIAQKILRRPLKSKSVAIKRRISSETTVGRIPRDSSIFVARDVSVVYGGVTAVNAVSLQVNSGEVVGLIGPNGAGKTSLIDALSGFVSAQASEISLNGIDLRSLPPHRRAVLGVSRSFQSLELLEDLTVLDNLRAASDRTKGLSAVLDTLRPSNPPLDENLEKTVDQMKLWDYLNDVPGVLPYGKRRLVGIARALATSPSVIMLDEPAAGLDERETRELATEIKRLAHAENLGVLLVEHDMSLVMSVCDRIVVLNFGNLVAEGTTAEVSRMSVVREAYLGAEDDDIYDDVISSGDENLSVPPRSQ